MNALILPFCSSPELALFRSLCPDFLLPVAGKAVTEHLVEQLVLGGIDDILMVCDDRPEEVSRHFGSGERWGCRLKVAPVRGGMELDRILAMHLHDAAGTVLCLEGNLVIPGGVEEFAARAGSQPDSVSRTPSGGVCCAAAPLLRSLAREHRFGDMAGLFELLRTGAAPCRSVESALHPRRIITPADLFSIQREILEERLPGIRIPARKAAGGIWLGDHVRLPSDCRLEAPLLIGSHSRVIGAGQIGPNTVIGSHCLVNNSDLITESILMPGTAAGPHTELNGMAARGDTLLNLKSGVTVTSPDPFILGEVGSGAQRLVPGQAPNMLAALLVLLLLSPVALPLFLLSLAVPALARKEEAVGNRRLKSLNGTAARLPFMMREIAVGPLLLRRWPALTAVLGGDLVMVGALPTAGQAATEHPVDLDLARGLFRIWEVEGDPPDNDEERMARENFHAVTRTFAGDLAILLKAAVTTVPAPPR